MKPLMLEVSRLGPCYLGNREIGMQDSTAVIPITGFLTKRPGPWGPFEGTS